MFNQPPWADRAEGVQGLTLSQVERNSAAGSAGLQVGERIAAVSGVEVNSSDQLRKAVRSHQPGEEVELRIQRDLNIELAPRPGQSAEGNRAIAGQGLGAFNPHAASPHTGSSGSDAFSGLAGPLPPSAPGGGGMSPHTSLPSNPHPGIAQGGGQQAGGFSWQPDQPMEMQPGVQAPNPPQMRGRVAPSLPRTERPPTPRSPRPGRNSAGQDQVAADLLEELRGLRAEVADLRRELEMLRAKGR